MTVETWVKKIGGVTKVSRLLGVSERSVRQWAACQNLPRDDIKLKIVKLSRGKMTYASMIENFFKAGAK